MKNTLKRLFDTSLTDRQEVRIFYFGRISEFLMVNGENLQIPPEGCHLGVLLERLRMRDLQWRYELASPSISCEINGVMAGPQDVVAVGDEISIHSMKSIFES